MERTTDLTSGVTFFCWVENELVRHKSNLFRIESVKAHIFEGNIDNPSAKTNLEKAIVQHEIISFLQEAKELFKDPKRSKGMTPEGCVKVAISLENKAVLKVSTLVFGKMKELLQASSDEDAKRAFFNKGVDALKRQTAVEHAISQFEEDNLTRAAKDLYEQFTFKMAPKLDSTSQEQQQQKAKGVPSLKAGSGSRWRSYFMWMGIAGVIGVIAVIFGNFLKNRRT
ncbi:MAG: hypothetical protein JSR58_05425 [Verrucomicrobia bacterium]|nr:hypothetical protein [Verrucomicrobiota bacterium]